jgi:hypothetical protein
MVMAVAQQDHVGFNGAVERLHYGLDLPGFTWDGILSLVAKKAITIGIHGCLSCFTKKRAESAILHCLDGMRFFLLSRSSA